MPPVPAIVTLRGSNRKLRQLVDILRVRVQRATVDVLAPIRLPNAAHPLSARPRRHVGRARLATGGAQRHTRPPCESERMKMHGFLKAVRRRPRTVALLAGAALAATGAAVVLTTPALAAATGGVGATLPYVEVQAENSATNGTVIGPSSAVRHAGGRGVLPQGGDAAGPGAVRRVHHAGRDELDRLPLQHPGHRRAARSTPRRSRSTSTAPSRPNFTLTNAYSWYYGSYPFTNSPGSNPHHFYDEVHRLFPHDLPGRHHVPAAGRRRLDTPRRTPSTSPTSRTSPPPLPQPAGSVSVTSFGADPTGVGDSTSAFNRRSRAAGPGGTVWIPPGTFRITGHIIVNNVTHPRRRHVALDRHRRPASASTATTRRTRAPTCTCPTSRSSATCRSATTPTRSTASAAR